MPQYSLEECCDIHLVYGACERNSRLAAVEYARRYPERRHPSFNTFLRLDRNLRETGSFYENRREIGGRAHNVRVDDRVIDHFDRDPNTSVRRAGRHFNVPKSTVHRVLHTTGHHPYHYTKVQHLEPTDFELRQRFSRWILRHEEELPYILWTDESLFTREGIFNVHNEHYWDTENPDVFRERGFQRRFKVNVWAGLIGNKLIGPHVLQGSLKGEQYLEFLQNTLPDLLDDVPLDTIRNMIYQHDGAPPHRYGPVVAHLNQRFGNHWIGYKTRNQEHIQWPPRSPDLTPLDFFLWGHLKTMVYSTPLPEDENEAEEAVIYRLAEACASLSAEIIQRSTGDVTRRATACLTKGGRQFEQSLSHPGR